MAQTSKESVEKKFKDVFGRSPGAFPEGTSLEEKVDHIAKGTEALKTVKNKELENKMKNVAELSKELESQKGHVAEEARQNLERLDRQLEREGIVVGKKVARLGNNPEFQEAANTLRETTAEGKSVAQSEQKKTSEASVQTDTQPLVNADPSEPKSQAVSPSVSESSTDTLGKTLTEGKSVAQSEQKKTSEASVQTDTQPSKHNVSLSMSKSSTKEKPNNKKPELDKKDDTPQPQENQKEEGLLSLLKRFVKKILEKLLGEDEKSVENARGIKEDAQRDTSNNEKQQKSMDQSSFININGKRFDLEPEKAFNYQDKVLNISITYNSPETKQNLQQDTISPHTANTIDLNVTDREYNVQNQLRPETEQHLQRDTASPNIANAINLNINGKEYSVQPGESFNYKSPGLEISVVNGHQQSKNFDKILNQDKSISEGLKQATKLENPAITPVNTPKVNEVNTGRER